MTSQSQLRPTLLLLLFVSTFFLAPVRAAVAPADLAALKQLFQKDPATAFEKSWRMFQEPRKNGDLEGMMEIIRIVGPQAERCYYAKVLDDMIDSALPMAQGSGKWETTGELCLQRATLCIYLVEFQYGDLLNPGGHWAW